MGNIHALRDQRHAAQVQGMGDAQAVGLLEHLGLEMLLGHLPQRPCPAVVRRDPMAMPTPSEMAAEAAASDPMGVVPMRLGQWQQPSPVAPGRPPGVPQPYQPPMPGVPGQPSVP